MVYPGCYSLAQAWPLVLRVSPGCSVNTLAVFLICRASIADIYEHVVYTMAAVNLPWAWRFYLGSAAVSCRRLAVQQSFIIPPNRRHGPVGWPASCQVVAMVGTGTWLALPPTGACRADRERTGALSPDNEVLRKGCFNFKHPLFLSIYGVDVSWDLWFEVMTQDS